MRNVKISADISEQANKILTEQAKKEERSKGYILDRLIKQLEKRMPNNEKLVSSKTRVPPQRVATSARKQQS